MRKSERVTIKMVAKAAGVSTQTISRVLNRKGEVSEATRQRIQKIIDDLDYRPSDLARSLIQQRSYSIGVITAGLKYSGPSKVLSGVVSQAEMMGYTILIKELPHFKSDKVEPIIQSLLARHVDGMIWDVPEVGDNQRWVKEQSQDLPVPFIFLTAPPCPDLPSVDYDNYLGGRMATEHLLQQGYRRIGHISGPMEWLSARERKRGWQDALREAGIDPQEMPYAEGNWSSASGEPAFNRLIAEQPETEAVFVANDQMAVSGLQMAWKKGIRVPQELAVVGFDGLEESAYFWPPLTTIYQDLHALGSTAVKEIIAAIESGYDGKESRDTKRIILQPQLIVRESSLRQE